MADENFRELEEEQAATGVVDAGDFEGNAGTGAVAEDQEAAVAEAQVPPAPEEPGLVGGEEQNIAPMSSVQGEEAHPKADLHEETGSGIDMATVIIVLLIVVAGLAFSIYSAMNAPASSQQTVAQQQAVQQQQQTTNTEPPFEVAELPEGVAAVVNGTEIPESDITEYVADFRKLYDLEDDDAWAEWMVSSGYTAEGLRNNTISIFVDDAIVADAVAQLDVQVSQEDVDEIYDSMRENFETDEEWQTALEDAGFTDESFREQCENQAQQTALMELLADSAYPEEEIDSQTLEYIQKYYPEYAEAASLDDIEESVWSPIKEMMEAYAQQEAYTTFLDNAIETGDIEMSAMPKGLPYDVNLLPFYFSSLMAQAQASQQQQQ